MQRTRVQVAVILGFLVPHICSLASSTSQSDCATCISLLCKKQKFLFKSICEGSEVCNMTIRGALLRFDGSQDCVCAWDEGGTVREVLAQCELKPAPHKTSTLTDGQSNSFIDIEDAAESCTEQVRLCVSDSVCNKRLAPVLQTCMKDRCGHDKCGQETQQFYSIVEHNLAMRLAMCDCDPSDVSCVQMKAAIHGSACEDDPWVCQEAVRRCVEDHHCRELLASFQGKCWSSKVSKCTDVALQSECFRLMNPALILGGELECRKAFVATLGTALHHPCSCQQVHGADLYVCNMIHDVLHNRSHFKTQWMRDNGPSNPPPVSESDEGQSRLSDYLIYSCAAALLVGILLMALLCKIRVGRRAKKQDKTRFQPLPKSHCIVTTQDFP